LKEGHIETDMGRVQTAILDKLSKDPVQVFDIIDVAQNL